MFHANSNIRNILAPIAIFSAIKDSQEKLDTIIRASELQSYERGEMIVEEGDVGHGMYIMLAGEAQVFTYSQDGDEAILNSLSQGQHFGEQSLLSGSSGFRNASVQATLDCDCLYVPAEIFREVVLTDDEQLQFLQSLGSSQNRQRLLQQSTVFRGLALTDQAAGWVKEERFNDGEIVFHQGDKGDKFYLVTAGIAQVYKQEMGSEKLSGRIPAGRYFGELALINDEPRQATIKAEGTLELLSLSADAFKKLYQQSPELQEQMTHLCGIYQLPGHELMTLHESTFLDMKSITAMYHFADGLKVSSSKVVGQAIFSMSRLDVAVDELQRVSYTRSSEGIMRELQLQGNKVSAVTVYGHWNDLGEVHQLILKNRSITRWQIALFRQTGELWLEGEGEDFSSDAIICKCAQISRGVLTQAVKNGCSSVAELSKQTGACQVCGSCAPLLAEIVGQSDMLPAKLLDIIAVTDEIKAFRFKPQNGEVVESLPGQHLRIETQIDGRWVQRAYTLTSPAGQTGYYEISVKREEHGLFSRWLHDQLDENSLVRISVPQGSYYLPAEHRDATICFAGGIGITPSMAMMRTLTASDDGRTLYVDYSARERSQFAYVDEWQKVTAEHPNIQINFRASNEQKRVQQSDVEELLEKYPNALFFLCGPKPFQDGVSEHIRNAGVEEERINVESFVPPGGNRPVVPKLKFANLITFSGVLLLALLISLIVGIFELSPAIETSSASQNVSFWSSHMGHQVTGFTVLLLLLLGLLMSARKRFKFFAVSRYDNWRLFHILSGPIIILLLLIHMDGSWGYRLADFLTYTMLAALLLGSLSALSLYLENKISARWSASFRQVIYWGHLLMVWPLPILLLAHIYSVYYF